MSITSVPGVTAAPAANYGSPWNGLLSPASPWYTGVASNAQVEAARAPLVDGIADQLGLDPTDLDNRLRDGASIAEVAGAKGIPVSDVVDAIQTLMVPNVNLNGEFVQRIALHKTAPIHHKHAAATSARGPEPVIPAARPPTNDRTTRRERAAPAADTVELTVGARRSVPAAQPQASPPPTQSVAGPDDSARLNVYL